MIALFRAKRTDRYAAAAEAYVRENLVTPGVRYSIQPSAEQIMQALSGKDAFSPEAVSRAMAGSRSGAGPEQVGRELDRMMNRSFVEMAAEIIAAKGLRDSAVYKAAQMDRRLFSKIMSDRQYKPARDTAVAIALALRLTLPEAEDLLSRAGYTLSHSIKRDVVIEYFFREGIYDLTDINLVLDKLELKKIGR